MIYRISIIIKRVALVLVALTLAIVFTSYLYSESNSNECIVKEVNYNNYELVTPNKEVNVTASISMELSDIDNEGEEDEVIFYMVSTNE